MALLTFRLLERISQLKGLHSYTCLTPCYRDVDVKKIFLLRPRRNRALLRTVDGPATPQMFLSTWHHRQPREDMYGYAPSNLRGSSTGCARRKVKRKKRNRHASYCQRNSISCWIQPFFEYHGVYLRFYLPAFRDPTLIELPHFMPLPAFFWSGFPGRRCDGPWGRAHCASHAARPHCGIVVRQHSATMPSPRRVPGTSRARDRATARAARASDGAIARVTREVAAVISNARGFFERERTASRATVVAQPVERTARAKGVGQRTVERVTAHGWRSGTICEGGGHPPLLASRTAVGAGARRGCRLCAVQAPFHPHFGIYALLRPYAERCGLLDRFLVYLHLVSYDAVSFLTGDRLFFLPWPQPL